MTEYLGTHLFDGKSDSLGRVTPFSPFGRSGILGVPEVLVGLNLSDVSGSLCRVLCKHPGKQIVQIVVEAALSKQLFGRWVLSQEEPHGTPLICRVALECE